MKRLLPLTLGLLLVSAACVTINVYFPSAEAAEAADRIIEEVRGGSESDEDNNQSALFQDDRYQLLLASTAGLVLDMLVPAANAQVDFNASTPATQRLEASLKERFAQLKPFYVSGAIGVTQQATVEIRDRNKIPLADRSRVVQLVAKQNADWNALYREIARANGHPEWESEIRSTFAARNIAKLQAGWWYQDKSGNWLQK